MKNTDIYISEDLTKDESYLYYLARQLRNKGTISGAWTEYGETFIKESQESTPRILDINDPLLNKLKQQTQERKMENIKSETQDKQPSIESGKDTSKPQSLLSDSSSNTDEHKDKYDENESTQNRAIPRMSSSDENHINSKENHEYEKTQEEEEDKDEESEVKKMKKRTMKEERRRT